MVVRAVMAIAWLILWLGVMFWAVTDAGLASVVSRHQGLYVKYVLHDMNVDGKADTVFEYRWNGVSLVFVGTYPYREFK